MTATPLILSLCLLSPFFHKTGFIGHQGAPTPVVRETPPPPGPPRRVVLPTPIEKRLPNGLRVVVLPKSGTGLLSVVLVVKGAGGASDPPDKAGLAHFTASLLTKGTTTRSAAAVAREIEQVGGSISAEAGWDAATLSLSVLSANAEPALAVMADVMQNPALKADEVLRQRALALDDLRVSLEEPGTLARDAAGRVVFGDGPYGHTLEGTPESLPRLVRADVFAFQRTRYVPGVSTLVFGGDITPDEAFGLAEKTFGKWQGTPPLRTKSAPAPKTAAPPLAGQIVVIDKPDAGQAAVLITRPAIARSSTDYYPVLVANDILGGGYSSRLNREVRVKRGLAYGAGSGVAARRDTGPFVAGSQTKNPSAGLVAQIMLGEMDRLTALPPSASELTTRKAALSGEYARGLESGTGLANTVAAFASLDAPLSALGDYLPRVQAISSEEVRRAAATYLSVKGASIVIVGNAKAFLPDLRKRFPKMRVTLIPASRLDLNRADLAQPGR